MLKTHEKIILSLTLTTLFFIHTILLVITPVGKENESVFFTIKSGSRIKSIAEKLKREGLIRSQTLFILTSLAYGKHIMAGEYELKRSMSIKDIAKKMSRGERLIYTFTIREGANIYELAEEIQEKGIMKKNDFLNLCFDKDFLRETGIEAASAEGYFYPDTYFFSKETEPRVFLQRIIKRRIAFFGNPSIRRKLAEQGYDIHKILTIASMIEKEAKIKEEKPLISAVFHNRIKKGMSLDCDPTVIYGLKIFGLPLKRSHMDTHTPYNTYKFKGLPEGPICNPDNDSIIAALHPAEVDFLYFVSRNDGTHAFSKEKKEHERYVAIYQKNKK